MNNIYRQETGGAFIKLPSARPSIHNHPGCVFAQCESMVRFGIQSNNLENSESDNDQGVDEIDNVLSKPTHRVRSPIKKNRHRRSSLETHNTSTDNDDDILSKSVPATLPSQLYYRTSDSESENVINNRYSDVSYHSVGTPNRGNVSRNSNFPSPQRLESARISERDKLQIQVQTKVPIYLIGAIVVVCAVICASGFNVGHISNINKSTYDQSRFYTDISSIGEKYNVDEDSILQVQTGISTIFEKQDAGSFIFIYNSKAKNFNLDEFNEFINDISLAAAKYLRNDSMPLHYTSVEGNKLEMTEHSELICRYSTELVATGVLLVRHLEAVPSGLAMAFHYYCDEYNPLVKKTAIFFTLNLATCPIGPDKKSLYALIEKCLAEKWSELPADNIGPLLARVVSVVVDVTSVF